MTMPETTASTPGRADIQAVDRVGQILGLFADGTTHLTTNGVALALGLNRTTAHRYLTSMAAEDLLRVSTDPPGYGLGSLILRLGGQAIGKRRVVAISAERMTRLADKVGTTISLSLWTPAGPVVARVQEPQGRGIVLTYRVGTVMPVDTAQAVVFLAFRRDAEDVEESLRSLPEPAQSITRAKVGEVRRTGLATAVSEVNGTCGLAAPIFDSTGVCAALAIVDTIGSATNSAFSHRLGHLQEAAQDLTARLGGSAPDWIG
ncbi:IclR family transcriptional regulator [Acrocarpospora pleiomorpha]|uniref:IclR family transcriptional regulator n=2 Tax=Acrocarpospora pleiomorpha TaxID=90975 RepID=A0A5M3XJ08_9ACTN|nr:IclR family transcriptional regulator [Acrocarpospora pleiomorpha]